MESSTIACQVYYLTSFLQFLEEASNEQTLEVTNITPLDVETYVVTRIKHLSLYSKGRVISIITDFRVG